MTLRIQIASDLHFEFHADHGRGFVAGMDSTDVDVLVVAGDLAPARILEQSISMLADRYSEVVYVPGNHELYGASPAALDKVRSRCLQSNLHWLEEETCEIGGQRFVGTPLWFSDAPGSFGHRRNMNDFRLIHDFVPWVFNKNEAAVAFLRREMRVGDVVVTHHLPSHRSTHERYRGSPLNAFFVCDIERLIAERQPKLLAHGHTHEGCDYQIGQTRVVCNPLGYPREASQLGYVDKFVVEVLP